MVEINDKPTALKPQHILLLAAVSLVSLLLGAYGLYAFYQAECYFVARGNPPWGTVVRLEGNEARMASTFYIGSGVFLFNAQVLNRIRYDKKHGLSWMGAALIAIGLTALAVTLGVMIFGQ